MRNGKEHGSQIRLSVFSILLFLFFGYIWSLDPDQPLFQYLVNKWDTGKGLPANKVKSISQTPDGYLWLATANGLARFDGIHFSIIPFYQKKDGESLETIEPDLLLLDKSNILWIAAGKSLTSYDYKTGGFRTFNRIDNMHEEQIRRIGYDMSGNLWISAWVNGVVRFSNGHFTFFEAAQGLEGKKINAIIENQKGNLLFGARDKGVFVFKDGKFSHYPIKELENLQVINMLEDRKGNLWIGTTQGLYKVSGSTITNYSIISGLSDNNVRYIIEDSEQNLWVGTDNGLNRLKHIDDGNIIIESLNTSMVLTLFEDNEKNLWVGSNNEDLKQIKNNKFKSLKQLEPYKDEILISLFEDRRNDTWIGTIAGKVFHMRSNEIIEVLQPLELKGIGITSIAEDFEGNLWLGSIDNGVFQKKNGIYNHYTVSNGLTDDTVTSIYMDSKHNLWFNTFNGVSIFRYQNRIFETFTSKNELAGKIVNTIIEDHNHDIWIGTNIGITVLKGGKTGKENIVHYLDGVFISCIYEDSKVPGVYWVTTNGSGLKRLIIKDRNLISCITYTTAIGMATNNVFQFLEDNDGWFWLMSDSGLLRVNKNELEQFSGDEKELVNIYCASFGTTDGMQSAGAANIYSKNSVLKTRNGELWFLTDKGISIVDPENTRINKIAPPVKIEAIFINQANIALYQEPGAYIFKGNSDFSVRFTAPTFISPEKIKFKYMLEGFDKEWILISSGDERAAYYKNLAPGEYTFKVIACNADGVWNETGDSITFRLKPYFYKTLIFKIMCYLILAVIGAALYFIHKKRRIRRNEAEEKRRYHGSPLDSQIAKECITKLKHLMEVKKVYRDEEISLQSLAQMVSTTPHILSQVLNEILKHNFADFINSYRVEEAVKILASPDGKDKKNWIVAHDVGFNNMGVFYRAFKKYTGITPNEYKKKQGSI